MFLIRLPISMANAFQCVSACVGSCGVESVCLFKARRSCASLTVTSHISLGTEWLILSLSSLVPGV